VSCKSRGEVAGLGSFINTAQRIHLRQAVSRVAKEVLRLGMRGLPVQCGDEHEERRKGQLLECLEAKLLTLSLLRVLLRSLRKVIQAELLFLAFES
jgi:hypothetical protein